MDLWLQVDVVLVRPHPLLRLLCDFNCRPSTSAADNQAYR